MNNKQHIQVPNKSTLTPNEKLVYAFLKKHYNNETKVSYPSFNLLMKETELSRQTLVDCITSLEVKKYINVTRAPKKVNIYTFNPYNTFDIFSFDFLEDTELPLEVKKHILCVQEYMFVDKDTHEGKISYTNEELSDLTGLSLKAINRAIKWLTENNYIRTSSLKLKDFSTGLRKEITFYNLDKLNQAILYTLSDHEDRISSLERVVQKRDEQIEALTREIMKLKKERNQNLQDAIIL